MTMRVCPMAMSPDAMTTDIYPVVPVIEYSKTGQRDNPAVWFY